MAVILMDTIRILIIMIGVLGVALAAVVVVSRVRAWKEARRPTSGA